ncbi:hypothetical protein SCOCK_40096 [Actinacidiphila cocklensis]|uniref:Uncharacterized protein n=1 Tax=Actinacidiphila cocklensis TaxID=887465 RepID=A0A9W4GSR9_9ACTN|nr:hypothetical protein SCOCK_40096 [Actinacidiphila cocklensis]
MRYGAATECFPAVTGSATDSTGKLASFPARLLRWGYAESRPRTHRRRADHAGRPAGPAAAGGVRGGRADPLAAVGDGPAGAAGSRDNGHARPQRAGQAAVDADDAGRP